MNNRITLIASAVLTVFFFVGGLLNVLDHLASKIVLFGGFLLIIINVILSSKPEENKEKNLP